MNKVMLLGRLSRAPQIAQTMSGIRVLNLDLETQEKWTDREGKEQIRKQYTRCVQFGKLADTTYNLLKVGDLVSVEGCLNTAKDKEDRWQTTVKIQLVEILNEKILKDRYPSVEGDT